jgi:hypothetical protein
VTAIADSLGNGESKLDRALRLRDRAELYRSIADDAWGECERAYHRAQEAESRAGEAEHEFSLALHAWEAAGGG